MVTPLDAGGGGTPGGSGGMPMTGQTGGAVGSGSGGSLGTPSNDAGAVGDAAVLGDPAPTDAVAADRSAIPDGRDGDVDATPPPKSGINWADAGVNMTSLFDGVTTDSWVQVPANSWSVEGGALHSLGTARGVMYSKGSYGDFRLIFTSRLLPPVNAANHEACVLFFGNQLTADALGALQVQPPKGYM